MDLTERGASTRRHPWEVQRFEAYRTVLAGQNALSAQRVLDVGAGDGWFAESLARHLTHGAEVVCWDTSYDDAELFANDRIRRTRERPGGTFDLVLALDVLEHVEDAHQFIGNELAPLTRAGASVLVAVPAYQRLFSTHDRALGHHRRYNRRELLAEIDTWVDVTQHGSLFTSLVPARAVEVALERVRPPTTTDASDTGIGGWQGGAATTGLANGLLRVDSRFGLALARRGMRLPGLSHWAFGVAR